MHDMKTVSVRAVSRQFSRHADLALQGEPVRVLRNGKPYVRIVADAGLEPKQAPRLDFAARARKSFGGRTFKMDLPRLVIESRGR
jgi:antitoxin (DNA-binding transcriptional repressor) of toxin-antitoxin stability system